MTSQRQRPLASIMTGSVTMFGGALLIAVGAAVQVNLADVPGPCFPQSPLEPLFFRHGGSLLMSLGVVVAACGLGLLAGRRWVRGAQTAMPRGAGAAAEQAVRADERHPG